VLDHARDKAGGRPANRRGRAEREPPPAKGTGGSRSAVGS
jgi:hypothetical protein